MISVTEHRIPAGNGYTLAAFEATPEVEMSSLVIILGNGIGGTMDCANKEVATYFAKVGIRAIAFDHLFFGESDGVPRRYFNIKRQLLDWDILIKFAKTRLIASDANVVLWGTSFGGSHVLQLAAHRTDIFAVIAQCPNVDFLQTVLQTPLRKLFTLIGLGIADVVSRVLGFRPVTLPLVGEPTSSALMSTPDAISGYPEHAKTSLVWRNQITASFVLSLFAYRPIKSAHKISCPALLCICEKDSVADPSSAIKAGKMMRHGQVATYACDHFELYQPQFTRAALDHQVSFLQQLTSAFTEEH